MQPPIGSSPPNFTATAFANAPVPWATPRSRTNNPDHVLFVRVIARRNFTGFPFWVSCPPETCARLSDVFQAEAQARGFGPGVTLASMSPETIGVLRERMELPQRPASFPGKRDFKQWLPGIEDGEFVLFGETEQWTHVRLVTQDGTDNTAPDSPPVSIFDRAARLATDFARDESNPAFARAADWGFLTSNPSYAGNGIQIEAGVHLPALAARRQVPQAAQALAAMGCELQPLSMREPGTADAGYFRLLTRGGLDLNSEELVHRFAHHVDSALRAERDTMERWRTREPEVLNDRMHRALRVLQEARHMEGPELQLLTSWARAGVYADLFPTALLPKLETLRVKSQPFHLSAADEAGGPVTGSPGEFGPQGLGGIEGLKTQPAESLAVLRAGLARRLLSEG